MGARIGERHIGPARTGEFAVQLNAVAHIGHHDKGRAAFVGMQGTHVILRLAFGLHHGHYPARRFTHGGTLVKFRLAFVSYGG